MTRPQIINLELEDLSAIYSEESKTEQYIAQLERERDELKEKLRLKPHSELEFVGFTNGNQLYYIHTDGEGTFYKDHDNECEIPLYMLKAHLHRITTTSKGGLTAEKYLEAKFKESE